MTSPRLVELRGVSKEYRLGGARVRALDGVSLSIDAGTMVAVTGPSGAGKSTLLHLIGGIQSATAGEVLVQGQSLGGMSDAELTAHRGRRVGLVFQFFNLFPTMTAWENVAVPGLLDGSRLDQLRPRALELLARVDVADRADVRPAQMSGGEQQRVAIARALVMEPALILADEPTGSLDSAAGSEVLDILAGCRGPDRAVILVSHDPAVAARCDRAIHLVDGQVTGDG